MVLTAIYRLIFYLHKLKIIGGVEINGRESEGVPNVCVCKEYVGTLNQMRGVNVLPCLYTFFLLIYNRE